MKLNLLARIYLSTAVAVTFLFAAAGLFLERQASAALRDGVESEMRTTLGAIDSSLLTRAEHLSTTSYLLASMSDVRAAFGTHDPATIRDTAGELWTRAEQGHADAVGAAFAVADPSGAIATCASRACPPTMQAGAHLPITLLDPARRVFPHQSTGYTDWNGAIWQVLVTPVYVDSGLLSILIAAHPLDQKTLGELKELTSGSEILLRTAGQTRVSTASVAFVSAVDANPADFAIRRVPLRNAEMTTSAELWAVRPFSSVAARVDSLRRTILIAWLAAMIAGLVLSYLLARRIVRPLLVLNTAAQEISRENYSVRVNDNSSDELGVLGRTFNIMAASIESARAEQLRTGQIIAVGRLAASIAHDLRNPLAAVVGGSEMLAEFDLSAEQARLTATQVHKAARRMENMLTEIGQVARSQPERREPVDLVALASSAVASQEPKAEAKQIVIDSSENAEPVDVTCEPSRVERVIGNLIANAIEALPPGGRIAVAVSRSNDKAMVDVSDDGPGIAPEIRAELFQPFVTLGKRNGLGLGLALARQTMLDHGGNLELVDAPRGAHFRLTLPVR